MVGVSGGKGGNDAHMYHPLSKTFVTALWNWGGSLLTQFCLFVLSFFSFVSHHRAGQTDRTSGKSLDALIRIYEVAPHRDESCLTFVVSNCHSLRRESIIGRGSSP